MQLTKNTFDRIFKNNITLLHIAIYSVVIAMRKDREVAMALINSQTDLIKELRQIDGASAIIYKMSSNIFVNLLKNMMASSISSAK